MKGKIKMPGSNEEYMNLNPNKNKKLDIENNEEFNKTMDMMQKKLQEAIGKKPYKSLEDVKIVWYKLKQICKLQTITTNYQGDFLSLECIITGGECHKENCPLLIKGSE